MVSERLVKSPCIGVCSTGIGDTVCRGCKRYTHEIISWNAYNFDEKNAILKRLDVLLSQVMRAKLEIVDVELLKTQLSLHKIHYNPSLQPYSWLFGLLKVGASQMDSLESYGCTAMREYQSFSITELRDSIDADFYVLSSVHYQRYFEMNETTS